MRTWAEDECDVRLREAGHTEETISELLCEGGEALFTAELSTALAFVLSETHFPWLTSRE